MEISVGRSSVCDLQVYHESVSRVHLRLVHTPHGIEVHDCGSSTGTWVNGRRVQKAVVQPGDEVKLANLITLDWENPIILDFMRKLEIDPGGVSGGSKQNLLLKVGVPVVSVLLVLGILFITGVFSAGEKAVSPSVTLSDEQESVVGVEGVKVVIPAGAAPPGTVIEATVFDTDTPHSISSENLASEAYLFDHTRNSFDEPITIELTFDPSLVPPGSVPYPVYLNDVVWVQVPGELEDSVFIVETDHLSMWAVFYDDVLQWERNSNPLVMALHNACETIFATETDKWESVKDDWELIQSNKDFYLGTLPEPSEDYLSDPPAGNDRLGSVHAGGNLNEVYVSDLPEFISAGNYSGNSGQRAVWCSHGEEWLDSPELVFKSLYTIRCREALEDMDREQIASELEDAAEDLSRMHFWHNAGSGVDVLQSFLSELLAHGSTGVPPSPAELLEPYYFYLLEGVVCRAEMVRFREELLQLAGELRNWQEEGHYSFDTQLVPRLEAAYTRIEAISELSRKTFPAFEENWFKYTASRVLSDFISLFVQREAAHLATEAVQAIDFDSALHAARLSSLLSIASDGEKARGVFYILCHILNAAGDNPLYEYYGAVHNPEFEIVDSFGVLVETAYILAMLEEMEDGRFVVDASGIITDMVTGLEWMVYTDDPGWRPTWEGFNYWAGSLGNGWRLPGISELSELYNAGINSENWGYFQSDVNSIWSGQVNTSCEDVPSSSALFLDFSTGRMNGYDVTLAATGIGGFAVRDPHHVPVQTSYSTLFYDGFENDRVGQLPGNWDIRYSGNTLQAVDSPVYAGNRAFMLRGNPSWVGSVTHSINLTDDFCLEACFYLPSGGLGRETQGAIHYNDGYGASFVRSGSSTFRLKSPGSSNQYGSFDCNEWHRIELRVDTDSQRYQVLLDGSLIYTADRGNTDNRGIELWSCNLHDQGAQRTVYFDEVKVTEGDYSF